MLGTSAELVDHALRQALDEITNLPDTEIPRHPEMIEALREQHGHTIHPAIDPDHAELGLPTYTCFMHAFRLARSEIAYRIASCLPSTFPGSDFVDYLAHTRLREKPSGATGDVVVYWADGRPSHAGVLRDGRVVSKWGIGQLWDHLVFEVPAKYGDRTRYFEPVDQRESEHAFIEFAREREGVSCVNAALG